MQQPIFFELIVEKTSNKLVDENDESGQDNETDKEKEVKRVL